MKTISTIFTLGLLGVNALTAQVAQTKPATADATDASAQYVETARDAHSRVWARVSYATNELGAVTTSTNSYTELATGLHYREGEQWLASEAKIEILPNNAGAAASKGQHRAIFPPEIKSGIIELQTPDNQWLRSRVWGISYFDSESGESVLIAEVKESEGQVVGDNVVIYPDAFTDFKADIKYTYTLAGFEQDVVLREKPPGVELWGLNPKTTRLQVLTEFVEAPTPAKESRQAGGMEDQSLGFGQMSIGSGKAFHVDAVDNTTGQVPVAKEWTPLEGRNFLIEQVHYEKVVDQLQKLPAAGEYHGASLQRRGTGENVIAGLKKIMPKRYAKVAPKSGVKRMAQVKPASTPGFVMDYVTLTSQTNFTFACNTNYYVSGLVNLSGTTTIEGGTIVKYTNHTSATISMSGTLVCKTDPYRPAVFTAKDDNTVGETITGSTGNPTNYYGNGLVINTTGYSLHNLRFTYAGSAVTLASDTGQINLTNVQFIKCQYPIDSSGQDENTIVINNGLFYSCYYVIKGGNNLEVRGNHLTVNQCSKVGYAPVFSTTGDLFLTNSLVVAATNGWGGFGGIGDTLVTNSTAFFTTDPGGILQTVGAANHYLVDNSPYRNIGTTNINATLANELKSRTTYPPILLTNNFTVDTVLSPQAQRDTDQPDLGYHYDPLDYVVSGRTVSANLTLTGGVALGTYGASSTSGLGLNSGSLVSEGTPTRLNWITRYNTVQEQSTTNWSASTTLSTIVAGVRRNSSSALVNTRFTGWSLLGSSGSHFYDDTVSTNIASFNHSQLGGGNIVIDSSVALTNCICDRVFVNLETTTDGQQWYLFNNLFFGGNLTYRERGSTWVMLAYDNLFDKTKITQGNHGEDFTADYNSFVTNQNRLFTWGAHDVILTNAPSYSTSTLGRWYLDSTTPTLLDVGSRTAPNATLYHFTKTTDQTKETTSQVDIGFHYVAVDGDGNPVDTDGDGVPDYFEDSNGNGDVNSGETDWYSATDLGLRVLITEPKRNSNLP